jgi:hypothetical protein
MHPNISKSHWPGDNSIYVDQGTPWPAHACAEKKREKHRTKKADENNGHWNRDIWSALVVKTSSPNSAGKRNN